VFSRAGGVEVADAAREVILAAGAVGSPHLLQLSGVGNPDDLAKANIPVHHPLPGVGHNFQDHYIARMSCEVRGIETLNERGRGLSFASELWRYVTTGTGMLTYSASLCAASVKVLEESATPDVQCVFAPASYGWRCSAAPCPAREGKQNGRLNAVRRYGTAKVRGAGRRDAHPR
jgi:choline dehydrogenase